jgi:hypothetical protein
VKQERTTELVREQEKNTGMLEEKGRSQEQLITNLKQSYLATILMTMRNTDPMLVVCRTQRSRSKRTGLLSRSYKRS